MQVTVIGAGYVGLVTGACLSALGHRVQCVDTVAEKVATINRGEAPFYEPGLADLIKSGLKDGTFRASADLAAALSGSEVSVIAVPTPTKQESPDLSFVQAATKQLCELLRGTKRYHVIVVKSTVAPGTTEQVVLPIVRQHFSAEQVGVCMNPEFLREGSAVSDFMESDRVVIGESDKKAGDLLEQMYAKLNCPKIRTTLRNAELIKYASNSLLATLISFSNELAALCEAIPGTDIETIMDGLHLDRRLSPLIDGKLVRPGILSYLRAGAGYGGSCLPKDVKALRWVFRQHGLQAPLLDAVDAVNAQRPQQILELLRVRLGELRGKRVALLGVAFKADTDDVRDSPALRIAELLQEHGCDVRAYDPMITPATHGNTIGKQLQLCESLAQALDGAEGAVIATAWPEFKKADWKQLCAQMKGRVIIDGRNLLRDVSWPAGVVYQPIGRSLEGAS